MSQVMAAKEHKIPVKQLVILSLCRFAEPISLTSIFPYLPEMIQSFDVPEQDVAFWAGLASAVYSMAQCVTAIPWGRASDHFGRKYVVLVGLLNTMITMLLWGFSTNIPMALVARALSGAANGNVGIIRTMVAEMCPSKDLQPRMFSVMPMVYNIGSVIGPAFGGALSNPLRRDPYDHTQKANLLWAFPYSLPNIVTACIFLFGIAVGTLFLHETLESRKNARDIGLEAGNQLTSLLNSWIRGFKDWWKPREDEEAESLLADSAISYDTVKDEETARPDTPELEPDEPISYRAILSKQTVLNLVVYTLLAAHSIAFDQILPVYMSFPRHGPDVKEPELPFKFNKGFGIRSGQIGMIFTAYGVVGIFYQFVIFPPVAKKYGALKCLRVVLTIMPVVYVIAPFSTLVPNVVGAQITLFAIWLVKGLCATFAFPCTTIMLTNTAPSLKVLGTINGMATSISAVGRAVGPALAGSVFSWGVKENLIIAPFWVNAVIGFLAPIICLWVEDSDGFGKDDLSDEEEVEVEIENAVATKPKLKTSTASGTGTPDAETDAETDDELGPLLSRETTLSRSMPRQHMMNRSSFASLAISDGETDDDGSDLVPISTRASQWETEQQPAGNGSGSVAQTSTGPGRGRRRRRSSAALGMGSGFRRQSTDLGQTRSGYGGGGGLDAFTRT